MGWEDPYAQVGISPDQSEPLPYSRTRPKRKVSRELPLEIGMVIEEVTTGWTGAITRWEKSGGMTIVTLEDYHRRTRSFPIGYGFLLDGEPVKLVPPRFDSRTDREAHAARAAAHGTRRDGAGRTLTASGSYALPQARARVAEPSRIWVEGRHDAELVEKVWGDDLRIEGIVVVELKGIDHLEDILSDFQPGPSKRAGVLVDHLIAGSKETRIANWVAKGAGGRFAGEHVRVLGHPYVDVWQAVKPERVGLKEWPDIPRHIDIKHGTLAALGWPHETQADIARGWQRILGQVRDYRDLEPGLLAAMEEIIDFVTGS